MPFSIVERLEPNVFPFQFMLGVYYWLNGWTKCSIYLWFLWCSITVAVPHPFTMSVDYFVDMFIFIFIFMGGHKGNATFSTFLAIVLSPLLIVSSPQVTRKLYFQLLLVLMVGNWQVGQATPLSDFGTKTHRRHCSHVQVSYQASLSYLKPYYVGGQLLWMG